MRVEDIDYTCVVLRCLVVSDHDFVPVWFRTTHPHDCVLCQVVSYHYYVVCVVSNHLRT